MRTITCERNRNQGNKIPRIVAHAIIAVDEDDKVHIRPVVEVDTDIDKLMDALRREFAVNGDL